MKGFQSQDLNFSREFRDNADIYVIERERLLGIMKSFYRHHFKGRRNISVLDLGCGDGIVVHEILSLPVFEPRGRIVLLFCVDICVI
jgi:hypothetical protein